MPFTNADKSKHGRSAQDSLEAILKRCMKIGYITQYISEYREGRSGYNSDQFYAPFLITFKDGTKWALFTTTSMRTDRIKGQQWDAVNLKGIDSSIKYVYLVYPDDVDIAEKNQFIKQNDKYVNKREFSAIDGVVSQEEINNLIEEYALHGKNAGQIKDLQGNNFEDRVAAILSFPKNLDKWKFDDRTIEGMHYEMFRKIADCFRLDKIKTIKIDATSDKKIIGKLPSGGNPKTDVLVTVELINHVQDTYTISCKRSSKKTVSIHQYNANAFANVLNPNDKDLRNLLMEFQKCGNVRDFGEEKSSALEKALVPYQEKLAMWAFGGFGGEGNENQCASYILTYDNATNEFSINRIQDYYQKLLSAGVIGQFGTIFNWTYPSKRKGKDIQLKCKII